MPQHYTSLGKSLGQALSEGVGGDGRAYEMGQNDGARVNHYNADTALKRRQLEMGNDENLSKSALMGAGLGSDQMEAFKQFLIGGKVDMPAPDLSPALATSSPVPPEMRAPTARPEDQQRFTAARSMVAALRNALMTGDSNSLNPTKAAQLNQTAAGDGTDATSLAALLAHGKTQFDPSANGVTNLLTGDQNLNEYGQSQIRANDASVVARKASANNSNAKADKPSTTKLAFADDPKALMAAAVRDYDTKYVDKITGGYIKKAPSKIPAMREYLQSIGYNPDVAFPPGESAVEMPSPRAGSQPAASAQSFKSVAEAEAAAKGGKIKVGDKIMIGGKSGTWR